MSSANFTKAGQERNIEVGLKIQSAWLAQRVIVIFSCCMNTVLWFVRFRKIGYDTSHCRFVASNYESEEQAISVWSHRKSNQ